MELQNVSGVNNQINSLKNDKKAEKQEGKNDRPQLKEHCSSKAANALRGMALGLALAAGVACSKGMVVQAADNGSSGVQKSNTNVTQEVESSTKKSDVEMQVDNMLEEQSSSSLHVGGKVDCEGSMTRTRGYEKAEITRDGQLVFYDEDTHVEVKTGVQVGNAGNVGIYTDGENISFGTQVNTGGNMSIGTYFDGEGNISTGVQVNNIVVTNETTHSYSVQNSFSLEKIAHGGGISLQPGARFNEAVEKNGDYIELAEDGKTFNVYDRDGNQIGSCQFDTTEEYVKAAKSAQTVKKVMIGGAGVIAAGVIAHNIIEKRRYGF